MWLTGLSGSGKSTLAQEIAARLRARPPGLHSRRRRTARRRVAGSRLQA
nr:adenylyl-sulfate kinase [Burkholderia ubonensis]